MGDNLDTELLVNCTLHAIQRFHLDFVNATGIHNYNRSEIVGLLSEIIDRKETDMNSVSETRLVVAHYFMCFTLEQ